METIKGPEYPEEATYNKLVRDKIPEIIEANGSVAEIKTLSREELLGHLKRKILEEGQELVESEKLEDTKKEMADVLEIIRSLAEELDVPMSDIEGLMNDRAEKRGRFKNRTYLVRTYKAKK